MEGTQTLVSEPPGGTLYTFTQDVEFRLSSQTAAPGGTRNWYYEANGKMQYYSGPSPAGTVTPHLGWGQLSGYLDLRSARGFRSAVTSPPFDAGRIFYREGFFSIWSAVNSPPPSGPDTVCHQWTFEAGFSVGTDGSQVTWYGECASAVEKLYAGVGT
jgi:hypothetical protein